MFLGALYVLLRRSFVYARNLKSEDHQQIREKVIEAYRRFRKPLLYIHNITLLGATIFGGIHGIIYWEELGSSEITGTLAWVIMVLLSIFGIILFYKFKVLWRDKRTKLIIRFIHRQWILTVLMIVFLLIHVGD